jgi:hypothetical protein
MGLNDFSTQANHVLRSLSGWNGNIRPWEQTPRTERLLPPRGTLTLCLSWGLHNIVEFLVLEHPQDVHSQGLTDNATPLHLASKNGHAEVARILIEHRCASERRQVLQQATKVLFIFHRMEFNSCSSCRREHATVRLLWQVSQCMSDTSRNAGLDHLTIGIHVTEMSESRREFSIYAYTLVLWGCR